MLSFKFISSSFGAESYYENEDDYYTEEDHKGLWEGEGADLLELKGGVDRETFKQLLDGILPNGEQVRKRTTHKQGTGKVTAPRLGIDFTFSAPKSVSIAALLNNDAAVVRAHDDAVRSAIAMLESKALARKKVKGVSHRQRTGNLIVAAFRHDLSRSQDPQLHTHAVAMNLTQRGDGQWVALTNDEMLKSVKLVGAYYRSELAQNLRKAGIAVRMTRDGFELSSVSDKAIEIFSKRSKEIEATLATKGLDRARASTALKQSITNATRPKKLDADRAALRNEWMNALAMADVDIRTARAQPAGSVPAEVGDSDSARRAVDFAIEHLAERQGIFTKGEILERAVTRSLVSFELIEAELAKASSDGRLVSELPLFQTAKSFSKEQRQASQFQSEQFLALEDGEKLTRTTWIALAVARNSMTHASAMQLVDESIANGRLVKTEERFTTSSMLVTERAILELELAGRRTVAPIMDEAAAQRMFATAGLNPGQQSAATLILTTPDRVVGVQGYAGTGKSHMLAAAVDAIKAETTKAAQSAGYTVIGIAPYASQNKALLELGMESQTLASFLVRKGDQARLTPKTIVFLDESSVVPAHQMLEIMRLTQAAGARLVLIGDTKQTQAVEAGKPFEQLQDAGMATAHLTEILRQTNPALKAAVVRAARGHIDAALHKLDSRTVEVVSETLRHKRIAQDYSALSPSERERTLLVAGTNAARQSINELVRAELCLPEEHMVNTYDSVDMTRAEKKMASCFLEGQFVMLESVEGQGLFRRVYYEVTQISEQDNRMTVRDSAGASFEVNPAKLRALSVFTRQALPLTRGDWVRITRNNTPLGLANGERYQVGAISKSAIQLSNGVVLPRKDPLHLQHGYAVTVNSAQGATTDRVMIEANTKSLTSNRAVFYVAISRPRHELTIYTDSRSKLAETMIRQPKKFAALELRGQAQESSLLAEALRQSAGHHNAVRKGTSLPPQTGRRRKV